MTGSGNLRRTSFRYGLWMGEVMRELGMEWLAGASLEQGRAGNEGGFPGG